MRTYTRSGVSIDGLAHLERWMSQMAARPACLRGLDVPFRLPDLTASDDSAKESARGAQTLLQH